MGSPSLEVVGGVRQRAQVLRILHTADWHLGHTLRDQPRDEEHAAFLSWLLDLLESEEVDALLPALLPDDEHERTTRGRNGRTPRECAGKQSPRCPRIAAETNGNIEGFSVRTPRAYLHSTRWWWVVGEWVSGCTQLKTEPST